MTDPNETNEEIYVELSPKDEGKEPLTDDDLEGVNGGVNGNRVGDGRRKFQDEWDVGY